PLIESHINVKQSRENFLKLVLFTSHYVTGNENIGPSWTNVWYSPDSPIGQTSYVEISAMNDSSTERPTQCDGSFVSSTLMTVALKSSWTNLFNKASTSLLSDQSG